MISTGRKGIGPWGSRCARKRLRIAGRPGLKALRRLLVRRLLVLRLLVLRLPVARRLLPGGVTHDVRLAEPFPLAVARAGGSRKQDLDGHELICYVLGHGALLLGHGHPAVVAAVREQAARSFHPGACHELESDWAELVIRLVPSAERVRFTSSGTEASLLALRLARAATGRGKIVKLAGHFHGWHDQVATGADPPFDGPDSAGLPPGTASSVVTIPAQPAALAAALAAGDVAGVILEPSGCPPRPA